MMFNLIPVDTWDYKTSDIIRSLAAMLHQPSSNMLLDIDGIGSCLPTRSARAAIIIAFRALKLPKGARIGVPLYCCPVVLKAITAVGCIPQFIDIDPNTFCVSPKDLAAKNSRLDSLIAVHMFGNLCEMKSLQELMNGRPIIEDCAQSLGSKIDGRMAGSFGTVSAFSFRSGKYLSVGEGGALFSGSKDINARITRLLATIPSPTLAEECIHVVMTYLRSKLRSRPLWGMLGHKVWALYNSALDFSAESPIALTRPFISDLAIARNRIPQLDYIIDVQRANAGFYLRNLQLDPAMLCFESPGTYYNRYNFPITFPSSEQCEIVRSYLQDQLISTSKPYGDVIEIAARYYGYVGDCPIAEGLLKKTLVIPSHFRLNKRDIGWIVHCINKSWANIRRSGKSSAT